MSLRSGTQKYGDNIQDVWINDGGYNRNLALEAKLAQDLIDVKQYDKEWKSGLNPERLKLPSWWDKNPCMEESCTNTRGWEEDGYTGLEAIHYLEDGIKILTAKINDWNYRCSNYPRDTSYCQHAHQVGGTLGKMHRMVGYIKKVIKVHPFLAMQTYNNGQENPKDPNIALQGTSGFEFLPQASAEEDPSIYQSDEVVTVTPGALTWYYVKKPSGICERLNVSQNFVNRMTSQGWVFSLTDICKTDVKCPARVRIINNETNQASGDGFFSCDTIEQYTEDPRYRVEYYDGVTPTPTTTPTPTPTTDHIPPPEETRCYMVYGRKLELTEQAVAYYIKQGVTVTPCEAITDVTGQVTEVPTDFEYENITTDHVEPPEMPVEEPMVTPTEPGQVNWIPEPFFSFINNVFRK